MRAFLYSRRVPMAIGMNPYDLMVIGFYPDSDRDQGFQ